jgi:hypothetical protein
MFVLVAGISAANDFVTLSAAKVMAGVVLVLLAGAVGLHDYPGTVFGVLFGAVFTALFALGQLLLRSAQPRTGR